MKLDIQRMLVLSLAHLSQSTIDALNGHDRSPDSLPWSPQITWEYGWIFWVDRAPVVDFPPEFAAIFKLAHEQRCEWVRFDEAGETIEVLPTFPA